MRPIPWLPETFVAAGAIVALAIGARLVARLTADLWVLMNALAQPSR